MLSRILVAGGFVQTRAAANAAVAAAAVVDAEDAAVELKECLEKVLTQKSFYFRRIWLTISTKCSGRPRF